MLYPALTPTQNRENRQKAEVDRRFAALEPRSKLCHTLARPATTKA